MASGPCQSAILSVRSNARLSLFVSLNEFMQKCCHYTVLTATIESKLSQSPSVSQSSVTDLAEAGAVRPGCFFSTALPDEITEEKSSPVGADVWEPLRPLPDERQLTGRWGHALVQLGGARLLCYGGFGTDGLGGKTGTKQARLGTVELLEILPVCSTRPTDLLEAISLV